MMVSDNNIIRIRDLHFSRGQTKIFDGVDIDIPQGKITAIMGPSGTGKTTLLKLIGGQLKPQQGRILFHNDNIPALNTKKLYQARKKMGMLFQTGALKKLTAIKNSVLIPH